MIALAVALVVAIVALTMGGPLGASEETMGLVGRIALALLALFGAVDAGMIERRRRNPSIPALRDDIRAKPSSIAAGTRAEADALRAPPPHLTEIGNRRNL